MYSADLVNEDGCVFDRLETPSIKDIRSWATGRVGDYRCFIYDKEEPWKELAIWRYRRDRKARWE